MGKSTSPTFETGWSLVGMAGIKAGWGSIEIKEIADWRWQACHCKPPVRAQQGRRHHLASFAGKPEGGRWGPTEYAFSLKVLYNDNCSDKAIRDFSNLIQIT
jgi:hypothetical protein